MPTAIWQDCLSQLQEELPTTEFNLWIRPLQAEMVDNKLYIYAPNRFVLDWVRNKYLTTISQLLNKHFNNDSLKLHLEVGSTLSTDKKVKNEQPKAELVPAWKMTKESNNNHAYHSGINHKHTFNSFVEGKSNQLAVAAAKQVAQNPGKAYNP